VVFGYVLRKGELIAPCVISDSSTRSLTLPDYPNNVWRDCTSSTIYTLEEWAISRLRTICMDLEGQVL